MVDSFGYNFDEIHEVYERYVLIKAYNPTSDLGIDLSDAGDLAKELGTDDVFKTINYFHEWDSAELGYMEMIFELIREEWDDNLDIDPEDHSEGTFAGLCSHHQYAMETELIDFSDNLIRDYQPPFGKPLNNNNENLRKVTDQALSLCNEKDFINTNSLSFYYPPWEEDLRLTPRAHRLRYFAKEKSSLSGEPRNSIKKVRLKNRAKRRVARSSH
jgi:hypothetical protein